MSERDFFAVLRQNAGVAASRLNILSSGGCRRNPLEGKELSLMMAPYAEEDRSVCECVWDACRRCPLSCLLLIKEK